MGNKQTRSDEARKMNKELIRELFDYRDGVLYWRAKPCNTSPVLIGSEAGNIRPTDKRRRIRLFRKFYYSYQLIYMHHHGYIPKYLDHINGNPSDDRIENLRECNMSQNNMNAIIPKHNSSGSKNVHWSSCKNKWIVKMRINKTNKHIGEFKDFELADLIAKEARNKYHGQFVCGR